MKVTKNKQQKIEELLKSRKKTLERIKRIDEIFRERKENEEAWPGHEGTRYQSADSDYHVFLNHLFLIDKELENLGVKIDEKTN